MPKDQNNFIEIGSHNGIISGLKWSSTYNALFSTGSDCELKVWDLNNSNSLIHSLLLPEKPVNIDISDNFLFIGFNNGIIGSFDLRSAETKILDNQFQGNPLCSIAALPMDLGVLAGFIHGHSEIIFNSKSSYFQCHRQSKDAYSVNSVSIFPDSQRGISCGGNGSIAIYNFETNSLITEFQFSKYPITKCVCASNGIVAVALGYDWKEGIETYKKDAFPVSIQLLNLYHLL